MAVNIKKFTRVARYTFLLLLATMLSAVLGSKSDKYSNEISLIPPTAQADVPPSGGNDGTGDDSCP